MDSERHPLETEAFTCLERQREMNESALLKGKTRQLSGTEKYLTNLPSGSYMISLMQTFGVSVPVLFILPLQ